MALTLSTGILSLTLHSSATRLVLLPAVFCRSETEQREASGQRWDQYLVCAGCSNLGA